MSEVVEANRNGTQLPKRAFSVTFDDGFENNYSMAAPILDDLEIPATFYVTTDFVDSNRASWIDRIEYAIERTKRVNLKLHLSGVQGTYDTLEKKIRLLEDIRRMIKNDPQVDPYEFAADVCHQLGVNGFEPDPDLDQKMNWRQVRKLSENRLFKIGGHGHTHRNLEYVSPGELEWEVATSVNTLRNHLEKCVEQYSYPEGAPDCYSDRVIHVLEQHGILCAPSAEHGTNRIDDDLFRLKRISVT